VVIGETPGLDALLSFSPCPVVSIHSQTESTDRPKRAFALVLLSTSPSKARVSLRGGQPADVQSALDSLVTFIVMVMSLLKPSIAKLCVSR
jgi:hypothetical protein